MEKWFCFLPNLSDSNSKTRVCFVLSFSSFVFGDFFFCSFSFCYFSFLIVDGFWEVLSDFPRLVDHQRRKSFGRGQMLHRGAHSEVRAGLVDAVRWELLASLVGSLFQTPLQSQLLGWFLPGLGSPGCNLGGRERENHKQQQLPRPPHCMMKWQGEL